MITATLTKPEALKKGDRVGLIAPGWRPYKPSVVSRAVKIIEEIGLIPVVGDNVLEVNGHSAGNTAQRVADINKFVNDDSIRALFCITGGFGALALLPLLDFEALKRQPKIIVGGGENTTILLGVYSRSNLVTFHGPNLEDVRTERCFNSLKSSLMTKAVLPDISAASLTGVWADQHSHIAVEGVATGPLIGGNLTGLASMFGTPFQPALQDAVAFLTDHDDRNDILDRWFTTLYVSGELQKIRGMLVGLFENCGNKSSFNILSLEDLFGERLSELKIPSMFDFPIAGGEMPTVPLGVTVSFKTENKTMQFTETALS